MKSMNEKELWRLYRRRPSGESGNANSSAEEISRIASGGDAREGETRLAPHDVVDLLEILSEPPGRVPDEILRAARNLKSESNRPLSLWRAVGGRFDLVGSAGYAAAALIFAVSCWLGYTVGTGAATALNVLQNPGPAQDAGFLPVVRPPLGGG